MHGGDFVFHLALPACHVAQFLTGHRLVPVPGLGCVGTPAVQKDVSPDLFS